MFSKPFETPPFMSPSKAVYVNRLRTLDPAEDWDQVRDVAPTSDPKLAFVPFDWQVQPPIQPGEPARLCSQRPLAAGAPGWANQILWKPDPRPTVSRHNAHYRGFPRSPSLLPSAR